MLSVHSLLPAHPQSLVFCAACGGGVFCLRLAPVVAFQTAVLRWHPGIHPTTIRARYPLHRWRSATTKNRTRRGNAAAPANGTGVVRRVDRSVAAAAIFLSSPHRGGAEWQAALSAWPIPHPSQRASRPPGALLAARGYSMLPILHARVMQQTGTREKPSCPD